MKHPNRGLLAAAGVLFALLVSQAHTQAPGDAANGISVR